MRTVVKWHCRQSSRLLAGSIYLAARVEEMDAFEKAKCLIDRALFSVSRAAFLKMISPFDSFIVKIV